MTRVLDAGSHAKTEPDVTEPMVDACIRALKELDSTFLNEIGRLEELRLRELRSRLVGMPSAKSSTISHTWRD